jgi:hypothetical protein
VPEADRSAALKLLVDPERSDPQARGYARAAEAAGRGLATLRELVHPGAAAP